LKKIDEKALKLFVSRWCYGFLFGQKRTHKKQKAKSKKQNRLSQTPNEKSARVDILQVIRGVVWSEKVREEGGIRSFLGPMIYFFTNNIFNLKGNCVLRTLF
jgi:hypothetical protein